MDEQLNDRIKNILSDPDSLKSILAIASAFGTKNNENSPIENKTETSDATKEEHDAPEGKLVQVSQKGDLPPIPGFDSPSKYPSQMSRDDRVNLLLSIKPFLNDKKRQRVDGLVKALGAARIISAYKDTDIFSKLL